MLELAEGIEEEELQYRLTIDHPSQVRLIYMYMDVLLCACLLLYVRSYAQTNAHNKTPPPGRLGPPSLADAAGRARLAPQAAAAGGWGGRGDDGGGEWGRGKEEVIDGLMGGFGGVSCVSR